jgi:hypothetical protein
MSMTTLAWPEEPIMMTGIGGMLCLSALAGGMIMAIL